ncbi:hypothetical protein R2601_04393 [Salipiger bermudensis HTCC2601]|uniref:Uncharacterized protein n=1 Tax=Salipiger bermudensis (strain DSM 26914 / JCM 13377 / KCTC 12554 / HTCC2601) TaxID=314265 RepID=Q0FVW7_SALBH|nr:hypothetical protein R2601_04393 [Salipiger bermudensis HTCC2601]
MSDQSIILAEKPHKLGGGRGAMRRRFVNNWVDFQRLGASLHDLWST